MPRKRRPVPEPTPTSEPAPTPVTEYTLDVPTDGRECAALIIAALAKVPDGTATTPTVASFPPGAKCGYDDSIFIDNRNHFIVDGKGAEFRALTPGDRNRAAFRIRQGSNVGIRNTIAHGSRPIGNTQAYHPDYESQHGYSFESVIGGWVESVQAYNVWGDFVEGRADDRIKQSEKWPSQGIVIRPGCKFEHSGRHGIGLTWVDGFTMLPGSWMHGAAAAMIDLEVNALEGIGRNIDIAGHFGAHRHAFLAHAGLRAWPYCGNVVLHDITQDRTVATCRAPLEVTGKDGARKANIILRNCQFLGGGNLAKIVKADDIIIDGCTFTRPIGGCANTYGTRWLDAKGSVTNSRFPGAPGAVYKDDSLSVVTESGNSLV